MYDAFVVHRAKTVEARAAGKPDPVLSRYLAECFILMADKIGTKYNFARYSYLDEMKDDAIENCIAAANNFDPEKSNNPFGYFTKTIWFAFLRRIEKEQKQAIIKYKLMRMKNIEGNLTTGHDSEDSKHFDMKIDNVFIDAAITNYEEKMKKKDSKAKEKKTTKKSPAKANGVEKFFEGDGEADA